MRKYYKQTDEIGEVIMLLTYDFEPVFAESDLSFTEITEEEYDQLAAEIAEKNQPEIDPDEISDAEAIAIITGVSE